MLCELLSDFSGSLHFPDDVVLGNWAMSKTLSQKRGEPCWVPPHVTKTPNWVDEDQSKDRRNPSLPSPYFYLPMWAFQLERAFTFLWPPLARRAIYKPYQQLLSVSYPKAGCLEKLIQTHSTGNQRSGSLRGCNQDLAEDLPPYHGPEVLDMPAHATANQSGQSMLYAPACVSSMATLPVTGCY